MLGYLKHRRDAACGLEAAERDSPVGLRMAFVVQRFTILVIAEDTYAVYMRDS